MAGQDEWLDEEVTFEKFYLTRGSQLNTIVFPRRKWYELLVTYIDQGGIPQQPVDINGKLLATETSGASIDGRCTLIGNATESILPTVGASTGVSAQIINAKRRIVSVPFTASGTGTVTNLSLVPALVGYYGVMRILGIAVTTTDSTNTFLFEDSTPTLCTGCIAGGFVLTLVAYTANKQLDNMYMYTGADNKALQMDVTGLANNDPGIITLEYFYET